MTKAGLRKGFTTGSCASAGAKAASSALFSSLRGRPVDISAIEITLPRGGSLSIPVKGVTVAGNKASATVIKDAGDDPDVTNGAEFVTFVELKRLNSARSAVLIKGGKGVGVVTRPGLKIAPGRPAINPVPLKMIRRSVIEALREYGLVATVEVTVTVPKGEELAARTMNGRLGIVGGISILGTTGIVEPMSLAAYTHSISCGVDVAAAAGLTEIVFSTGRSSERVLEKAFKLKEQAYILTGDHMGYALRDVKERSGLKRVTVAGQFGKFSKLAAGHFETHCSDSSVELSTVAALLKAKDSGLKERILNANTAREVFFILKEKGLGYVFDEITMLVRDNSSRLAGRAGIRAVLVGYEGEIVSIAE